MNNRMLALGISAVCAALLVGIGSFAYRTGAPPAQSAAMEGPSTVGLGSSGPRLASANTRARKEARRRTSSKQARQVKYARVQNVEAPAPAVRRSNPRLP